MKNIKSFVRKHWFGICVVLVIILAGFLRFYNYDVRWALAHDQARDALIAREALGQHRIPTLGPFSQAGSFVMGPIWYWLVTIATAIYSGSILTPWIVLTISYLAVVYVMMLSAKELGGKYLSIIVGIFTAVSTSQIAQSANLTNPSGVAILSACSVYFAIKYIRTGKSLYIFLFPFFISLSVNVHLQAVGLLPLFLVTLFVKRPRVKQLLISIGGFILPFLPLLYFDIKNNFYDTRSLIDYYLYGQHRIYVPNRWLTYVGEFWPTAWARIIGGEKIFGYLAVIIVTAVTFYAVWKRNITKQVFVIILTFLIAFVMLRYFRGERFDSYLIFLHPFILLLTGWACLKLFKLNYILGVLVISLLVFGSIRLDYLEIKNSTAYTQRYVEYWKKLLVKTYPDKKFALYDLRYRSPGLTLPLGLYLDGAGKISDDGYKIGFGTPTRQYQKFHTKIKGNTIGFELWDLNSSSSAELSREGWAFVNPSAVYHATEDWYKDKKL